MLEFKRVLVPVDFSEHSRRAVGACSRILSPGTGEVHFLHAWRPPPEAWTDPRPVLLEQLNAFIAAFQPAGDHEVVAHVAIAVSGAAVAICDYAKEHHCDLIVISTHGRTGLGHVLMGSTAERVVQHAPCPVLIWRAMA